MNAQKPITSLSQPPNLTLSNALTSNQTNPSTQMPPNNIFSSSLTKQQPPLPQQTSNQLAQNSNFQSNLNLPSSQLQLPPSQQQMQQQTPLSQQHTQSNNMPTIPPITSMPNNSLQPPNLMKVNQSMSVPQPGLTNQQQSQQQPSQNMSLNNNKTNTSLSQQLNINLMNNMLGNIGMSANSNGTNGGNNMLLDNKMPLMQSMGTINDKSVLNLMPNFDDPVEQSLASLEQSLACKSKIIP